MNVQILELICSDQKSLKQIRIKHLTPLFKSKLKKIDPNLLDLLQNKSTSKGLNKEGSQKSF